MVAAVQYAGFYFVEKFARAKMRLSDSAKSRKRDEAKNSRAKTAVRDKSQMENLLQKWRVMITAEGLDKSRGRYRDEKQRKGPL